MKKNFELNSITEKKSAHLVEPEWTYSNSYRKASYGNPCISEFSFHLKKRPVSYIWLEDDSCFE
jgi:hypothetical protein